MGLNIVSGSHFSGLTTFANLPYASCFVDGPAREKYNNALLGAPFDTVSQLVPAILCLLSSALSVPIELSVPCGQSPRCICCTSRCIAMSWSCEFGWRSSGIRLEICLYRCDFSFSIAALMSFGDIRVECVHR